MPVSFLRLRRDRPTLKIYDFQNRVRNIAPPFSLRLGHRTALVLLTPFTTVLPLRYRVGSLVGRSKFPYGLRTKPYLVRASTRQGIAARDTIHTNYAFCTVCTYDLLTVQYTVRGGMQ